MHPSSLVFVAIVVGWAAYLVPQWLQRRDGAGDHSVLDGHTDGHRMLDRRPRPASGPSSVPILTDGHGIRLPVVADPPAQLLEDPDDDSGADLVSRRGAVSPSTLAARRRARILSGLLAATAGSWALLAPISGAFVVLAAVVTGLLVLDVVALVVTARQRALRRVAAERRRKVAAERRRRAAATARRAPDTRRPQADAPLAPPLPAVAASVVPAPVVEPEPTTPVEPPAARVARELAGGGTPWVPIPVPPPTYTLKPAAPRPEPAPLDLPEPHAPQPASPAASDAEVVTAAEDDTYGRGLDLDAVLDRRRAVNG